MSHKLPKEVASLVDEAIQQHNTAQIGWEDLTEKVNLHIAHTGQEVATSLVRQRAKKFKISKVHLNGVKSGVADKQTRLGRIADLLEKNKIDIDDIGRINKVTLKDYQMGSKDEAGNPQVTDLESASIIFSPKWEDGASWDPVTQARPVRIAQVKVRPQSKKEKVAVILPDPQIGYRHFMDTNELDPFHDEQAMNVALQVVKELQPDLIVNLGDFLDFPAFGKYEQEASWAQTTQHAIDRGYRFLAEQRAYSPNAEIIVMEGNHDRRLDAAIKRNFMSSVGLKRACGKMPVLSVPFLLRFDELNVTYQDGYPAARYWINDRLAVEHGYRINSAGSTAHKVAAQEGVSIIFGHIHRIETHYKTMDVRGKPKTVMGATPGCLCRIDGAVPSMKGSTNVMGRPILKYENWVHGMAVVEYEEGDGAFSYHDYFINPLDGYSLRMNGKTYRAN